MANNIKKPSVYIMDHDGTAHKLGELTADPIEVNLPKPRIYANPVKFVHSFKIAGKAARRLNRELRRAFKPETPYKKWGVNYKNLSLKHKVDLKNLLKLIQKYRTL